MVKRKDT
ncbi:hypothetical protein A6R68_13225 [Neotoma lepida]|nr:hypothetical protein A6R68_13225 [Neotoma lepida]